MGRERYVPFVGTFRSSSFSSWYLYNHISSSNICLYCVHVYNGVGRGGGEELDVTGEVE